MKTPGLKRLVNFEIIYHKKTVLLQCRENYYREKEISLQLNKLFFDTEMFNFGTESSKMAPKIALRNIFVSRKNPVFEIECCILAPKIVPLHIKLLFGRENTNR